MSDWLAFEGRIEPLVWGTTTYTILRLPGDVAEDLLRSGARRVEGEFNDHPVNLALVRTPAVDGVFLWTGKALMDRIGVGPGELMDIRLRPADDKTVDTPDDISLALTGAGLTDAWDALSPGKRRGLLYKVETARTLPTRQKRITALLSDLSAAGS
jgi:hypothetical protein